MNVIDSGNTLVLSDTSESEKKRILQLIKQPEEQRLETLTRKQAAKIFGIHPGSLKRWEKTGRIRAIKITPRTVRYNAAEIRAMVEGGAV